MGGGGLRIRKGWGGDSEKEEKETSGREEMEEGRLEG